MNDFYNLSPAPAAPVLPPPGVFDLTEEDIKRFEEDLDRLFEEGEWT